MRSSSPLSIVASKSPRGAGQRQILERPKRFSLVLEEETFDELVKLAGDERVAPAV